MSEYLFIRGEFHGWRIVLGAIYRPPGAHIDDFTEQIRDKLMNFAIRMLLYADNVVIIISDLNYHKSVHNLNLALDNLRKWSLMDKLKLNPDKTKYMTVTPRPINSFNNVSIWALLLLKEYHPLNI